MALVLSLLLAMCALVPANRAAEAPAWEAMNYGPYLTASIEAPQPRTNIAYKGIAINLGANFGGDHNEAIVFDTDLLRYSAAWTGQFVALKGVVFDGEHWAYPKINGHQILGNPVAPGWSKGGHFKDPREVPFGPLPRDWGHWKGLYLHGKKVILSYTVGSMPVLEMPTIERKAKITAFVRSFDLGAAAEDHAVQLAFDANRTVQLVDLERLKPAQATSPAEQTMALLTGAAGASADVVAFAVRGTGGGCRWLVEERSQVRLRFPAHARGVRYKVFIWSGPRDQLADFSAMVRASAAASSLEEFTKGGPPRWPDTLTTKGRLGQNAGPYALDTLTEPEDNPWHSWMRFGGVDFFPDGKRLAVCTWNGDVWIVHGVDGDLAELQWQRVATGLFQPLGLQVVDGQIYVLGRDQITRLRDLNGDGETDFYENFNNDCMTSEHFHEFALDLKLGPDGNFYYIKCACHAVAASHPHHGTLMRVSRDGSKLEVVARGFRAANGLGVGPRGEFTSIDNQGFWMPGNRLNWIKPGGWYGNQLAWNPENRTTYDEPLCWIHNFVDRSGGTQLWVPTDHWGPLKDELITISYGMGHMFLVLKEEVDGVMQGAVTRFPLEFETGAMRGVFHPQTGQLYTCGLYGWAGNKTKAGGLYRVRYQAKPLHLAKELHFVRDGIVLGFTDALDPEAATDPGNYDVSAWNYRWTANYGSPDFKLNGQEGRDSWTVKAAQLSADRKRVFLEVPEIQRVMQLHISFRIRGADGSEVANFVHGTIHKTSGRSGAEWLGAGALARTEQTAIELAQEAPGLVQLVSAIEKPDLADIRLARLPALFAPEGTSPTPFIEPGRFRARWEGYLKVPLNETMTFEASGQGRLALKINGQVVLDSPADSLQKVCSRPTALRNGLNRFELDYSSPAKGNAELRLSWSSSRLPAEPVPPTAFVHDAADARLTQPLQARAGRHWAAEYRCFRCHLPEAPWPVSAMPELQADAPAFDGMGDRLNQDWIAQWLLNPKASRPDALMPRMLFAAGAEADARDLAAFLASLRTNQLAMAPAAPTPATPEHVAAGNKFFTDLGCVACHRLPGELSLTNDDRVPLDHVAIKWRSAALAEFLRAPARHFQWTRMPDFKLSPEEVTALSAFLLSRSQASASAANAERRGDEANPKRGGQLVASLGCLNCHELQSATNTFKAPAAAALLAGDWTRGCLAGDAAALGRAPEFPWTSAQREALQAFSKSRWLTSLEQDTPTEFAARQYPALRCQACHARDLQTDLLTQISAATKPAAKDDDDFSGGGSVHIGRPPLTYAGEKLYAGWMQRFLDGTLPYKPRPALQGRMPAFPKYAERLATGLAHEHGYPAESAAEASFDPELAKVGAQLTQVSGGFSCVSCHNVGSQKALAGKDTATVNFACVAERLRPSYYWRYVQDPPNLIPGTMMPKFIGEDGTTALKNVYNGDPQKQFTAIWHYLQSLRAAGYKE